MEGSAPPRSPAWSARQAVLFTLFIVGVALAGYLLYTFRSVLALILLGLILGTAIRPAVDWLQGRHVPRGAAVLLVYVVLLAVLALFVVLIVPPLVSQISSLATVVPGLYIDLRETLRGSMNDLLRRLGEELPTFGEIEAPRAEAEQTLGAVVQSLEYAQVVILGLMAAAVVLLFGYYWAIEGPLLLRHVVRRVRPDHRDEAGALINDVQSRLGQYVAAQGFLSLAVGTLALIAYIVIGLPYTILLAVFAAIMEAVPMVGPALGAIPALFVALSTDPNKALWVVGATVIIQLLENNLLVPRLMSRVVGINPLVTLLALAAFGAFFGYLGILLAVPVAAVIQLLINRLVLEETPAEGEDLGRDRVAMLRYEAQELIGDARRHSAAEDGPEDERLDMVSDEIEAIARDLDLLLEQGDAGRERS